MKSFIDCNKVSYYCCKLDTLGFLHPGIMNNFNAPILLLTPLHSGRTSTPSPATPMSSAVIYKTVKGPR